MIRYLIAITIISIILFSFEFILYWRWRKRLSHKKYFKGLSYTYWTFVAITHLQLWFYLIIRTKNIEIPFEGVMFIYFVLYAGWQYTLSILFLPYLVLLLLIVGIEFCVNFIKRKKPSYRADAPRALGRKEFIFANAHRLIDTLPFAMSAVAISGMFMGSKEILTENISIPIKNLHEDLYGFKIIQISDIHIGNLIHERYLKYCLDRILPIKADMLVVTGDIIDNNNQFLKIAGHFFEKLSRRFPLGCYGCMGNHDYIDNGKELYRLLDQASLHILRNTSTIIQRGRGSFNLMGLDYPNPLGAHWGSKRIKTSEKYFENTKPQSRNDIPTIVLNHHPSDFAYLQNKEIDLVLSGHTHGGQIRFSSDRNSPLSLASLGLDYYIGQYEEKNTKLYVNRGLGHWMPLRINCPTEITVIELVQGKTIPPLKGETRVYF